MAQHDIVTIGASAGGVETLTELVGSLPEDLPAALFVVVHLAPESTSVLPQILDRAGPLRATQPSGGETIEKGRIYVAPPDHHLVLKQGIVSIVRGPTENRHRPAIDALFRSAARIYGPRVVGVLLTGAGDDGVSGLRAIKLRGGKVLVQDPDDAAVGELPRNAIKFVAVDHCVPIAGMALLLDEIVREPAPPPPEYTIDELDKETRIAQVDLRVVEDDDKVGSPSAYSCPDCGGVLWEIEEDDFLRFRCRVGHSYSALALADEQNESLEKGLWAGFRALEEASAFARRQAVRSRRSGHPALAERFMERAEEASMNAERIREMILRFNDERAAKAQLS